MLEITNDNGNDAIEHRRKNGDVETKPNSVSVARARLRFEARRWILSKALPKIYGQRPDPNAGQVVRDTLAELLQAIDGQSRGLPNRPAIVALPPPQQDDADDT
jgi:hypothetical protein